MQLSMTRNAIALPGTPRPVQRVAVLSTASRCRGSSLVCSAAAIRPVLQRQQRSASWNLSRTFLSTRCAAGVAHPGEEQRREDGGVRQNGLPIFLSVPGATVAKSGGGGGASRDMGSGGSLGAQVLERSKMDFVMPTPVVQGPKLDDSGSGGDIGGNKGIGGGDGSGGGGDDDDYAFNDGEGDDGEGGDGSKGESFFKTLLPELYDRASLGAVLSEWFKTVAELPLIIRRAVEMGLFSSAQLTRFLAMDVRPGVVRNVARKLPDSVQSQLVGRLMADPGFVHKLVIETTLAAVSSLYYEMQARGDRCRQELDLVTINTVGMAVAAGASLWLVAPSRAYGALHKFPWQQMLHGLPNCVFDSSGPLRSYTRQARLGGWVAKMGEVAGVGALTGATTALLSQGAVALRRRFVDADFEPSVAPAGVMNSSAGLASFFALNAHTRYQLIGGMDKYLFDHSNSMLTYLGITTVARIVSNRIGEVARPGCQGLPEANTVAAQQRQQRRRAAIAAAQAARRTRRKAGAAAARAGSVALVEDMPTPSVSFESAPAVASSSGQSPPVTVSPEAEREAFGLDVSGPSHTSVGVAPTDAELGSELAAAAARLGVTATHQTINA